MWLIQVLILGKHCKNDSSERFRRIPFRYIFANAGRLRRSLEERRSDVNIAELKERYEAWWAKYQAWTTATNSNQSKVCYAVLG